MNVPVEPSSYSTGVTTRSMAKNIANGLPAKGARCLRKNGKGQVRQFGTNISNQPGATAISSKNARPLKAASKPLKRARSSTYGRSSSTTEPVSPALPPSKRMKIGHEKKVNWSDNPSVLTSAANSKLKKGPLPADLARAKDPRYCSKYIGAIVDNLHKAEPKWSAQIKGDYMNSVQQDITPRMRSILVDWMIEVHNKFKLRPETVYLTIDLMDRYLSAKPIHRSRLQLLGCTCMWVASKYHEIYAPEMKDFVYISDNAFNIHDLLKMETDLVMTLDFNLTVPTALAFADRFIEVYMFDLPSEHQKSLLTRMTQYLIERALMTYDLVGELRSKLAAAALFTAVRRLNVGHWTETIARVTRYTEKDLMSLTEKLRGIVNSTTCSGRVASGHSQHKAVVEKYSKPKRGQVATIRERQPRRQRIRD